MTVVSHTAPPSASTLDMAGCSPHLLTWPVCVLIQGVNQGQGWHGNEQHNRGGDDSPDDLQRGVVGQLLGLHLVAVVELGADLCNKESGHK